MRYSLDQWPHGELSYYLEHDPFVTLKNRYPRFAHSLTPLDTTGDGVNDIMVLMGGYAPNPINDVWITTDGLVWAYVFDIFIFLFLVVTSLNMNTVSPGTPIGHLELGTEPPHLKIPFG